MYASCQRDDLVLALQKLARVASQKSTLPILSHVLLEAREGKLVLTTTDLALMLRCSVPAQVQREGQLCVPAKLLGEVLKNEPGSVINLRRNPGEGSLTVESFGRSVESRTRFKSMSPREFPDPVTAEMFVGEESMRLFVSSTLFKKMLGAVLPYVQKDTMYGASHANNAVLFSLAANKLTLAAINGAQLASYTTTLPGEAGKEQEFTWLLYGDEAKRLISAHMLPDEETRLSLQMKPVGDHLQIAFPGMTVVARVGHDAFPDYQTILAGEAVSTIQADRGKLVKLLKRLEKMVEKDWYKESYTSQMESTTKDTLLFTPRRPKEDVEAAQFPLSATWTGAPLLYNVNSKLLLQILESLKDVGTVHIEVVHGAKAIFLRVRPLIPSGLVYALAIGDGAAIEEEQKNDEEKNVSVVVKEEEPVGEAKETTTHV